MIVNKKARFEYHILKEYVTGLQLVGSEVKSLRSSNANISDAYCYIWNNEVFVKNMFISTYKESTWLNHEERRDRKLLLNKSEIREIYKLNQDNGITIVPLEVFTINGRFKLKIGVAKGKKNHDKRNSIKEREIKREISRNWK